jgi:type VI secretion system secreted protein Hcp
MDDTTTGTPRRELLKGAAGLAAGAAAVSVLGGGSVAVAASPGMSMTLDGIGTFPVLAWSWGASSTTSSGGSGGGAGRAAIQDLSVTKYTDAFSPQLLHRLVTGTHVATGRLDVATKDQVEAIELESVLVSSWSTGGSAGEDRLTDNLTLNFAKFTYTVGPNSFRWDITANTGS